MKKYFYTLILLAMPLAFGCEKEDNPSDKLIERILSEAEADASAARD